MAARLVASVGDPDALSGGTGHHDAVPAGGSARDDQVGGVAALHGGIDVLPGGLLEPTVLLLDLVGDLAGHGLDPLVEQAVAGLLEQQPTDRGDDHRGQDDGAGHDAGLD